MNEYIREAEFGKAVCELNAYKNAMTIGIPPYKTEEELLKLKETIDNFWNG